MSPNGVIQYCTYVTAFGTRAARPNVKNVPVERGRNGTVGAQRA